MNEWLFLSHALIVVGFVLAALRLGKNALIALIALQGVLANLFVVKQMTLFGFSVTCSDVFAIGGILSLNLLQEYFGRDAANSAVRVSLLSLVFFACMSQIHLFYAPLGADPFPAIFSSTSRIVLASISTFFIVQKIDVRVFALLKGYFPLRVAASLFISQFIDTVLFSFLGLYGLVDSVFDIIVVSFLIKCLIIAISAPFVAFSKKVIKHVPI